MPLKLGRNSPFYLLRSKGRLMHILQFVLALSMIGIVLLLRWLV
jgi:hypothetical protein